MHKLTSYLIHHRKKFHRRININGKVYEVEYSRSPFWTNETPTLKLYFKEKFCTWHGQVWEVFKNGSRCGFGTICLQHTLFPRKQIKQFLIKESSWLYDVCYKRPGSIKRVPNYENKN